MTAARLRDDQLLTFRRFAIGSSRIPSRSSPPTKTMSLRQATDLDTALAQPTCRLEAVWQTVVSQDRGASSATLQAYDIPMIILSHITALHHLRHIGAETVARLPRLTLASLNPSRLNADQARMAYLAFAESSGTCSPSLHLLRPIGHPRWETPFITTHFATDERTVTLVEIGCKVYAPTPEYLIQQLSALGDIVDLTQLVFELCSIYSHPTNNHIELKDRKSFTTKRRLQRHLEKHRPFRGSARLEQALKLSKDRSASHMETACAMLLGFPYRLGGLNFPEFEMNHRIDIPRHLRKTLRRARCYGDLCWQDRKLVLEYDSNEEHANTAKIASDSDRRNALLKIGYDVITLTGNQIYNFEECLRTARILAGKLGHRIQPRCKNYWRKHHLLRRAVLKDQASVYRGRRHGEPDFVQASAGNRQTQPESV